MPYWHVSLWFSWLADYTWVEQFWIGQPSREAALFIGRFLAEQRFKILGAGATCYRVRVCQDGLRWGCISSGIVGTALVVPALPPIEGLEVRLSAAPGQPHWRNYCLRGLPAAAFSQVGSRWILSPAYRGAVQTWLDSLVSQKCLLVVEQALGPPLPILGLNQCATNLNDIYGDPLNTLAPPPGTCLLAAQVGSPPPAGGGLVNLHGVRPTPNTAKLRQRVNGTRPLLLTTNGALFLLGNLGGAATTTGGTVQVRRRSFLPIAIANPVRRVGRKCGPFKEAAEIVLPELAPLPALPAAPRPIVIPPPSLPNVIPVVNQYFTLQDVMAEVFRGYNPVVTPSDPLIGIAPVARSGTPTFAVFLAGVDSTVSNRTTTRQYLDSLQSFVGLPDEYTSFVRELLRQVLPSPCLLYVFGHSFGGFVCQWLDTLLPLIGDRQVVKLVACGTAWIVTDFLGPLSKKLFYVRADPVPFFSPGGNVIIPRLVFDYLGGIGIDGALAFLQQTIGFSGMVLLPGPDLPLTDIIGRHNCYNTLPACLDWNWDGTNTAIDGKVFPLQTGAVQRYNYPP